MASQQYPPVNPNVEGVASQLSNLEYSLFGNVTKSIVNNRWVWNIPCSVPGQTTNLGITQNIGEGFLCYSLRVWDEAVSTVNSAVASTAANVTLCASSATNALNSASSASASSTSSSNSASIATTQASNASASASSAANSAAIATGAPYMAVVTKTGSYVATSSDSVIFCEPSGVMSITLPQISSMTSGKVYRIWTSGAFAVTINANASDTINGASSFVMSTANEAIEIISNGSTKWRIM